MDCDSDNTYCSNLESDPPYDSPIRKKGRKKIIIGEPRKSQRVVKQVEKYCIDDNIKKNTQNRTQTKTTAKRGRPKKILETKMVNDYEENILLMQKCLYECKDIITRNVFERLDSENTIIKNIYLKLDEILKKSYEQSTKFDKTILQILTEHNNRTRENFKTFEEELIEKYKICEALQKIHDTTKQILDNDVLDDLIKIDLTRTKMNNNFDQHLQLKSISFNLTHGDLFCFQSVKGFIEGSRENKNKENEPNEKVPCKEKDIPESVEPKNVICDNILSQDIFESPQMFQNNTVSENHEYLSCIEQSQEKNQISPQSQKIPNKITQISEEFDFSQRTICFDESQQSYGCSNIERHVNKANIKSFNGSQNNCEINIKNIPEKNLKHSNEKSAQKSFPTKPHVVENKNDPNFKGTKAGLFVFSKKEIQKKALTNNDTKLNKNIQESFNEYNILKPIKPVNISNSDKFPPELSKYFWNNPYAKIPTAWSNDF